MTKKTHNLLLLILLACCWGPSFLFTKLGLTSFGPLTLVNCRLIVAAIILSLILKLKGMSLAPYRRYAFNFLIVAIFNCSLPFSLISIGVQYIPSSLAAIVNSTVPIFTVVLAHFFIADEKLTSTKIFGILLSFCGILLVFLPATLNNVVIDDIGVFLVFLAAISYAISMTYSRRYLKDMPFLVSATFQLIIASVILLPFTLFIEPPDFTVMPTTTALIGLAGLAVLGTAIAFNTFFKLAQCASASYLSTTTLLFPVIAMTLGALVLGERLEWNAYAGSGVILLGLMVANRLVSFGRVREGGGRLRRGI
jgi:drug/metabolite transporter (DMT)-like permease